MRDSSTKAVMAARSFSRQGMVRGVAVRASSAWACAMGDACPPCRLVAGISPAPKPDKASLCASTHSLPPCKTAGAAVYCCSDSTVPDVLLQPESVVAVLVVRWQRFQAAAAVVLRAVATLCQSSSTHICGCSGNTSPDVLL